MAKYIKYNGLIYRAVDDELQAWQKQAIAKTKNTLDQIKPVLNRLEEMTLKHDLMEISHDKKLLSEYKKLKEKAVKLLENLKNINYFSRQRETAEEAIREMNSNLPHRAKEKLFNSKFGEIIKKFG